MCMSGPVTWDRPSSVEKWLWLCKVARGPALWCQLYTYITVSIRREAVTHIESIMSAGRLHTNYEQHQQMTACTYCCFPAVHMPSYTCLSGGVIQGCMRGPLKWQRRWRGTNAPTRHCWQATRKPLYLPCCYSTVHWGWNGMNNVVYQCMWRVEVSGAQVDITSRDRELTTWCKQQIKGPIHWFCSSCKGRFVIIRKTS